MAKSKKQQKTRTLRRHTKKTPRAGKNTANAHAETARFAHRPTHMPKRGRTTQPTRNGLGPWSIG